MIHDIFTNIAIFISFFLVLGVVFKKNTFENRQLLKTQISLGVVFGTLGIITMLYTIKINSTIIDLRNIAIICAGIMGGPLSSIIAAIGVAVFRLTYFGINSASFIAHLVALLTGGGITYISTTKLSRRAKFIYMFLYSMLISNIAFACLVSGILQLLNVLAYYWLIYVFSAVLAYFTFEYVISANMSYKALSYYRITGENLADMLSTQKPGGEIVFVSPSSLQLLGYTPEELVGTSSYDYIHPEDKEALLNTFSLRNEVVSSQIFRAKRKDGKYIWVETSIKYTYNDMHRVNGVICVTRDISARKKIEQEIKITNARLKAIFDNAGTGIVIREMDGTLIDANPAYLEMIGYTKEQVNVLQNIVHPDDFQSWDRLRERLISGECSQYRDEFRYIDKDGMTVYTDVITSVIPGTELTPPSMVRIVNNITERKKMEAKLRESEERFRTAFNNAAVGIYLSSLNGQFIKVNSVFADILGYSEDELDNMSQYQITHPDDFGTDADQMEMLLKCEIPNYHCEFRYIHKDGNIVWVQLGISIVQDADIKPQYLICQVQDITLRKRAEEELEKARLDAERLARTDFLTGIMNRRAFMTRFEEEFYRVNREKASISLILTDIDYFKSINDTYGHQVGDLVLQKFTQCLTRVCRPYDFVGRIGGEEFAVCLPNTGRRQAEKVAERMRAAVEELTISLVYLKEPIKLTASFGMASPIKGDEESTDLLILHADKAMYKAKSGGRNKVCTY